jgi:2-amino-4-hydroxy-6-hydroxymethyldihydropteridine diphosphokinase
MEQKVKLHQVVIALGTNLGDKELNLNNAISQINSKVGEVSNISSIFKNSAVGFESENEFYNSCLICETKLSPEQVLKELQEIEKILGRIKTKESYEDRVIDLDIIFYEDLVMKSENLQIPHPNYQERNFVLFPLLELSDFKDPKTDINISQLIR